MKKVDAKQLLDSYKTYKTIVKSKAQEKQIDRDFQKLVVIRPIKLLKKRRQLRKDSFPLETKYAFARQIIKEAGLLSSQKCQSS